MARVSTVEWADLAFILTATAVFAWMLARRGGLWSRVRAVRIPWVPGAIGLWLAVVALILALGTLPLWVALPLGVTAIAAGIYETARTLRHERRREFSDSALHSRLDAVDQLASGRRVDLRGRAMQAIKDLLVITNAFNYSKIDRDFQFERSGGDAYAHALEITLAENDACYKASAYAAEIVAVLEGLRLLGIAPEKRPPLEWIASPRTVDQISDVRSYLVKAVEMMDKP